MYFKRIKRTIFFTFLFSSAIPPIFSMDSQILDRDIGAIKELIDLDKAMRSGYKPIEEISQENARSNIVKQSIRDTLMLLGEMTFPIEVTPEAVEKREVMLTSLTDCIRFYMGGEDFIPKHLHVSKYLDFLNYFADRIPLGYSEAHVKHLSELLVYCQLITTAIDDFRKATPNDLKKLSEKLDELKKNDTILPVDFIRATRNCILKFDQEAIDRLTDTLPKNLKEMIDLEHAKRTDSTSHLVNWQGSRYRGEYDFEKQGQRIQEWRQEADETRKKLYLMVGRTNNEIPAIQSDHIMWVYADIKAHVMNPKGDRHLLWDMKVLGEPNFLPNAMFDGIVLDPSTWKFLGGNSLPPLLDANAFDKMKEYLDEAAKVQENSIKGLARILTDTGFVSFESIDENNEVKTKRKLGREIIVKYSLPFNLKSANPETILNDFYNHLKAVIDAAKSNNDPISHIVGAVPPCYTRSLFNKYFYAGHPVHEEFSFQDDYFGKDTFLPFTPTTPKMKDLNNDTDYMSQRFVARYPRKGIQ